MYCSKTRGGAIAAWRRLVCSCRATVLLLLALTAGAAAAAPFQNGSFEGPAPCNVYNIPAGSTLIPGWTVSVGNIDWEGPPPCGWQASNGSNSIDLVGDLAGGIGGVTQTFDTTPGQTYVVAFDLAGNYGGLPVVKPLAVTIDGVTTNFTFDTTGKSGSNMGWTRESVTFTATGTSSTLTFVSNVGGLGGIDNAGAVIDNVTVAPVTTSAAMAVPLSSAQWLAALLVGLAAVVVFRRRGMR